MPPVSTSRARAAARREEAESAPGFAARRIAAELVEGVLRRHHALDELLDQSAELAALEPRDRALARALVACILRRLGTLRALVGAFVERGLPAQAPRVETALLIGAAQILFFDVPDHAAVDLAVRLAQADRPSSRYAGLVNAVLRRIAREGRDRLPALEAACLDTPHWLLARWTSNYGEATARAVAAIDRTEPALDLSVKGDGKALASRLDGRVLPTGTVRAVVHGAIAELSGFAEGEWWVQDAAAALPARLLGDVRGRRVADLCAAPGGKTAQLALSGAKVVAVDRSAPRLKRLTDNLSRLSLSADVVCADATAFSAEPFDGVLLDAPCSATGTIRRHPDIAWLKSEADILKLTALQHRLIAQAAALTKSGGVMVYCTCSLERDENEDIVEALLARESGLRRLPVTAAEISGCAEFITPAGDLRTLPSHWPASDSANAGLDGFYAARLVKD